MIEPSCDVVGIVKDGRSLLVEAERLRPDVIVMEVLLPLLNSSVSVPLVVLMACTTDVVRGVAVTAVLPLAAVTLKRMPSVDKPSGGVHSKP